MEFDVPDNHPTIAYEYLENLFKKARIEGGEQKLSKLHKGLSDYFNYADEVQLELIRFNLAAAKRLMIVEALLVSLDQNPNISNEEELTSKAIETLKLMEAFNGKLPEDLSLPKELLDNILETQKTESWQASSALRETLEKWVLELPVADVAIPTEEVDLFIEHRETLTKALNQYQSRLFAARDAIDAIPTDPGSHDLNRAFAELRPLISNRIHEVEDFRNGITNELNEQDTTINNFTFSGLDDRFYLNKTDLKDFFTIEYNSLVLHLEDIPRVYCQHQFSEHPAIQKTGELQDKLQKLSGKSFNSNYHRDVPGIGIKENGKKSWQRTIEKLIFKKGAEWDEMTDLSRMNVFFENAESMYSFNRITRAIAKEYGWEEIPRGAKGIMGDKGPRMAPTGAVNWNMNFTRASKPGKGLVAELKLDSRSTHIAESATHPLYEIARQLESAGKRVADSNQLKNIDLTRYEKDILSAIGRALRAPYRMPEEARKKLKAVKSFISEFDLNIVNIPELHDQLNNIHAIISFDAMRSTQSPSMAAYHTKSFKEHSAHMKDLIQNEKNEETAKHLSKQLDKLTRLFDNFGPRAELEYDEVDLNRQDALTSGYEKGWSHQKERA